MNPKIPKGNLSREVKTHVPEDVADDFARAARQAGSTTSSYLRDLIYLATYGRAAVLSMYEERLDRLAGRGPDEGQP